MWSIKQVFIKISCQAYWITTAISVSLRVCMNFILLYPGCLYTHTIFIGWGVSIWTPIISRFPCQSSKSFTLYCFFTAIIIPPPLLFLSHLNNDHILLICNISADLSDLHSHDSLKHMISALSKSSSYWISSSLYFKPLILIVGLYLKFGSNYCPTEAFCNVYGSPQLTLTNSRIFC